MLTRYVKALPSAFTLTSVFFGLLCIVWAATQPYWAAIAIVFAGLCDGLDGRVARMTRTESEFGAQLDSLADVVSFGVAPAILLYSWALQGAHLMLGPIDLGLIVAFVFVGCGAIRLARFNVMAAQPGASKDFTGLPIPAAAGLLAAVVMTSQEHSFGMLQRSALVIPLMLLLSFLMVSTVQFRSFKKRKERSLRRRLITWAAVLIGVGVLIERTSVGVLLISVGMLYVLGGVVPAIARLPGRLRP